LGKASKKRYFVKIWNQTSDKYSYPFATFSLLCDLYRLKKIKPQKAQRIHKGHGEKLFAMDSFIG